MGSKKSAPPPAPDPVATARAQGIENRSAAVSSNLINMVDQVDPFGNALRYNQIGHHFYTNENGQSIATPKYEAVQTLSPEAQRSLEASNEAEYNMSALARDQSSRLSELLARPMNLDGLPALTGADDFSADRQRVEDALMSRMSPQMDRDRTQLQTSLINRGIREGSQAWQDAISDFDRKSNDARYGAILNAGSEQSRLVALANDARKQALSERFAVRNQPINEITALLSGSQVDKPTWVNTPTTSVAAPDYAGMVYKNYDSAMDAWKTKQQSSNAQMGGLFGLGGSVIGLAGKALPLMLSDRRAKTDIEKVGKLDNGTKVYSYRYKGGGPRHIGVMAQEVEKRRPDAVKTVNGFKMVDYAKATED